jgi:hypothetical protein
MMKSKFIVFLIVAAFAFNLQVQAQTDFNAFWTKFKNAVKAKDKTAVAALTKFPLSMPYGQAAVKNKAQLATRFDNIFNGEASAAKCFSAEKPVKDTASRYIVACGFKNDNGDAGKPIVYSFEKTKTGWKFVGLDNINE